MLALRGVRLLEPECRGRTGFWLHHGSRYVYSTQWALAMIAQGLVIASIRDNVPYGKTGQFFLIA